MKTALLVLYLFAIGYIECKKTYVPIDKNANLAFINMEGGGIGGQRAGSAAAPAKQGQPASVPGNPAKPAPAPAQPAPATIKPGQQASSPTNPGQAAPVPTQPAKPTPIPINQAIPAKPTPAPKPPQSPTASKPVNPAQAPATPTTPGPGSVKHLINFYDSQGKASPIRPYTYSQAVKQGK